VERGKQLKEVETMEEENPEEEETEPEDEDWEVQTRDSSLIPKEEDEW